MKLKILPLEGWMKCKYLKEFKKEFYITVSMYTQIKPIYYKDGYYCYGSICWFEVGGEAWKGSVLDFNHILNTLNASEFNYRQINALKTLEKEFKNLITTKQKDIIYYYDHWIELKRLEKEVYNVSRRNFKR